MGKLRQAIKPWTEALWRAWNGYLKLNKPQEDPGPSAADRGQGRLKTFTEGWDPPNHGDPGPSATDHGSGVEFPVHDMMKATVDAELRDTGSYLDALPLLDVNKCAQLPPEVLAQLQRIEDLLNRIEKEHILRRTSSFTVRGVTWPGKDNG